jgi:hypothetical protein
MGHNVVIYQCEDVTVCLLCSSSLPAPHPHLAFLLFQQDVGRNCVASMTFVINIYRT